MSNNEIEDFEDLQEKAFELIDNNTNITTPDSFKNIKIEEEEKSML